MAKLYGIYDKNRDKNQIKNILEGMFDSFEFGNPDYAVSDSFGVGHLKIKTINRKGISRSKNIVCCFSGKLFNFYDDAKLLKQKGYKLDETKEEDFILNSYLDGGIDFVKKLNGTFAFVVYDNKKDAVYIVNDRYGMKPIYYYYDSKKIVFASEVKAIITDEKIGKNIDWDFWKEYFSYGYGLGNKTPFKRIKSLSNASIIKYSKGKCNIKKYWEYDKIKINKVRSVEETINEGSRVLKNVFQRQTKDIKNCMVLLSGGYDSRCIATSIKKFTDVNIHSFTIAKSYPAPPPVKGDMDARYARRVAEILGIRYTVMGNINALYESYFIKQVKQLDCLCYEHIWTYPLVDKISDEFINFDGIAGDVILKGGIFVDTDTYREEDLSNNNNLNKYSDDKLAKILHRKMLRLSLIDYHAVIPFFNKEISSKLLPDSIGIFEEVKKLRVNDYKIQIFQMKNRTRNAISLTANNIFMRKTHSLMPLCDNELVDFALSIPLDVKIKDEIYKKILKKTFPEVMRIPTTNDPKDIKKRMKNTLLTLRMDWLRYSAGDIAKLLKKLRSTKTEKLKLSQNPRDVKYLIKLANNINIPDLINRKQLLEQTDYHLKNDIDPSYFLEPIMQFCVWYNLFILK